MWTFYYIMNCDVKETYQNYQCASKTLKLYKNKIKKGQGQQQEVNKTLIVKKRFLLPTVSYADNVEFNA